MIEPPSMLSLVAAGFYVIVVSAVAVALLTARKQRQQAWHSRVWMFVALVFLALAASRVFSLEDLLRAELRDWLRAEGAIAGRRVWQGYLIAGAIAATSAGGLFACYWASRRIRGRRNLAVLVALGSTGAMLMLVAMRLISLHALDQLLFGPFKLNWIGDIGLSLAVLAASVFYVRILRQPRR